MDIISAARVSKSTTTKTEWLPFLVGFLSRLLCNYKGCRRPRRGWMTASKSEIWLTVYSLWSLIMHDQKYSMHSELNWWFSQHPCDQHNTGSDWWRVWNSWRLKWPSQNNEWAVGARDSASAWGFNRAPGLCRITKSNSSDSSSQRAEWPRWSRAFHNHCRPMWSVCQVKQRPKRYGQNFLRAKIKEYASLLHVCQFNWLSVNDWFKQSGLVLTRSISLGQDTVQNTKLSTKRSVLN